MFRRELIDNRALTEQAGAFHPPYPERIGDFWGGQQTPTGAIVREDGSVLFRLYAPGMDRAEAVLTAFPACNLPAALTVHLWYNQYHQGGDRS